MLGCQCSVRWDIAARLSRWSSLKIRRALTSAFTIFVTEKSCCWMSLSLILFARPTWPSQQPQLEAVQQSATRKRGRSTASLQRILATCSSHLRLKFTAAGVQPLSTFAGLFSRPSSFPQLLAPKIFCLPPATEFANRASKAYGHRAQC